MTIEWETELASLLNELVSVQDDVLAYLAAKTEMLVSMNLARLSELEADGERLSARLKACHDRRGHLLAQSAAESRPVDSLRELAQSLPAARRQQVDRQVAAAAGQARLLRTQSFTHWAFVQRSLIHLAQLMELIATGGKPEPTYGRAENTRHGGSLVDQAA